MSQVTDFVMPGSPLTMAGLAAELNADFAAIISWNSGAVAPSNPVIGMFWLDTSGGATAYVLKQYTAGGWISLFNINSTAGTYTIPSPAFSLGSDADGDIYYRAASVLARLAKGTARQQLNMNSGATAPEWVASPQSVLTAQGDILYASAANTLAKLAKGAADTKLFINAAATAPEWAKGINAGTFNFELDGASGTQTISSVGFKPAAGIFLISKTGTINFSVGFDDGTTHYCACMPYEGNSGQWYYGTVSMMVYASAGGINKTGYISAWNADGFDVTWVRNGATPSGTYTCAWMVWR